MARSSTSICSNSIPNKLSPMRMKHDQMKWLFLCGLFLKLSFQGMAQDPNFHIYLCFGQSNMEGQGPIETQDKTVDSRFQVIGAVTCSPGTKAYTEGKWTTATPPIFRCDTKFSPVDYFGRTMVANLPTNIKVGVVPVAIAGCDIALFDKVNYASYAATAPSYMQAIINQYGGNPYGRLVEVAKLAQKDGVIKGILFHQGETNSGQTTWPAKVKAVYDNLIKDLGLDASKTPFLAGEVLTTAEGGSCGGHNAIIATLPNVIPNSYVISASGLPGQSDNLHFTSASYRTLGQRYAQQMLKLLPTANPDAPVVTLTAPTTGSQYDAPATVGISATVTDSNNDVAKVEFFNGKTKLGEDLSSPYTYTWDNVAVGTYAITAVATDKAGNTDTSAAASIKVTTTFKIYKTSSPIVVDGTADAIWNNPSVGVATLSNVLSGTIANASDLSASFKALWDNTYLYVWADVTDQTLTNDSPNSYDDDAVEVYVDINNDKATTYGANDVQYTFGWNDGTTVGALPSGRATTGITYAAVAKTGGYVVEARIPWTTLQGTPAVNQMVGIEFMVNDDDNGGTRDKKLAWTATTDNAWQDPSLFGTAQLKDLVVTALEDTYVTEGLSVHPNPFQDNLKIDLPGSFQYEVMTMTGQTVESGNGENTQTIAQQIPKGLYLLRVSQSKTKVIKIVKE